jgi:flagellin
MTAIGNALNQLGNDSNAVDAQITYNKSKMDALRPASAPWWTPTWPRKRQAPVAADPQQLGTQSLSIANQAPQSLLSLFR